jgi:hypothetical protein
MNENRMKALLVLLVIGSMASNLFAENKVLEVATGYADGGGYNKEWKGSGTPEKIVVDGKTILSKGTNGTYCSGFTFSVVMRAAADLGLLAGKTVEEVRTFQKEWYGVPVSTKEKQCVMAAANLGIGTEVGPEDAKAGDFVQFWRNNGSGHSVIFLGWNEKDGKRVGIKYRSSQGSTKGIGNTTETIGSGTREIHPGRIYLVRLKSS